jgi:hypothetical protein
MAVLVFGRRRKQLPQPPDRRVHGSAPPLGIQLRPKQVDKPLAAMRAIRKREEESSQSSPGWTEIRPYLFVAAGNSTGAEQTYAQHGRPLPARTRLKSTPKNVVLAFSHSSAKLQPQFKI